jgi:hypothetical protein
MEGSGGVGFPSRILVGGLGSGRGQPLGGVVPFRAYRVCLGVATGNVEKKRGVVNPEGPTVERTDEGRLSVYLWILDGRKATVGKLGDDLAYGSGHAMLAPQHDVLEPRLQK